MELNDFEGDIGTLERSTKALYKALKLRNSNPELTLLDIGDAPEAHAHHAAEAKTGSFESYVSGGRTVGELERLVERYRADLSKERQARAAERSQIEGEMERELAAKNKRIDKNNRDMQDMHDAFLKLHQAQQQLMGENEVLRSRIAAQAGFGASQYADEIHKLQGTVKQQEAFRDQVLEENRLLKRQAKVRDDLVTDLRRASQQTAQIGVTWRWQLLAAKLHFMDIRSWNSGLRRRMATQLLFSKLLTFCQKRVASLFFRWTQAEIAYQIRSTTLTKEEVNRKFQEVAIRLLQTLTCKTSKTVMTRRFKEWKTNAQFEGKQVLLNQLANQVWQAQALNFLRTVDALLGRMSSSSLQFAFHYWSKCSHLQPYKARIKEYKRAALLRFLARRSLRNTLHAFRTWKIELQRHGKIKAVAMKFSALLSRQRNILKKEAITRWRITLAGFKCKEVRFQQVVSVAIVRMMNANRWLQMDYLSRWRKAIFSENFSKQKRGMKLKTVLLMKQMSCKHLELSSMSNAWARLRIASAASLEEEVKQLRNALDTEFKAQQQRGILTVTQALKRWRLLALARAFSMWKQVFRDFSSRNAHTRKLLQLVRRTFLSRTKHALWKWHAVTSLAHFQTTYSQQAMREHQTTSQATARQILSSCIRRTQKTRLWCAWNTWQRYCITAQNVLVMQHKVQNDSLQRCLKLCILHSRKGLQRAIFLWRINSIEAGFNKGIRHVRGRLLATVHQKHQWNQVRKAFSLWASWKHKTDKLQNSLSKLALILRSYENGVSLHQKHCAWLTWKFNMKMHAEQKMQFQVALIKMLSNRFHGCLVRWTQSALQKAWKRWVTALNRQESAVAIVSRTLRHFEHWHLAEAFRTWANVLHAARRSSIVFRTGNVIFEANLKVLQYCLARFRQKFLAMSWRAWMRLVKIYQEKTAKRQLALKDLLRDSGFRRMNAVKQAVELWKRFVFSRKLVSAGVAVLNRLVVSKALLNTASKFRRWNVFINAACLGEVRYQITNERRIRLLAQLVRQRNESDKWSCKQAFSKLLSHSRRTLAQEEEIGRQLSKVQNLLCASVKRLAQHLLFKAFQKFKEVLHYRRQKLVRQQQVLCSIIGRLQSLMGYSFERWSAFAAAGRRMQRGAVLTRRLLMARARKDLAQRLRHWQLHGLASWMHRTQLEAIAKRLSKMESLTKLWALRCGWQKFRFSVRAVSKARQALQIWVHRCVEGVKMARSAAFKRWQLQTQKALIGEKEKNAVQLKIEGTLRLVIRLMLNKHLRDVRACWTRWEKTALFMGRSAEAASLRISMERIQQQSLNESKKKEAGLILWLTISKKTDRMMHVCWRKWCSSLVYCSLADKMQRANQQLGQRILNKVLYTLVRYSIVKAFRKWSLHARNACFLLSAKYSCCVQLERAARKFIHQHVAAAFNKWIALTNRHKRKTTCMPRVARCLHKLGSKTAKQALRKWCACVIKWKQVENASKQIFRLCWHLYRRKCYLALQCWRAKHQQQIIVDRLKLSGARTLFSVLLCCSKLKLSKGFIAIQRAGESHTKHEQTTMSAMTVACSHLQFFPLKEKVAKQQKAFNRWHKGVLMMKLSVETFHVLKITSATKVYQLLRERNINRINRGFQKLSELSKRRLQLVRKAVIFWTRIGGLLGVKKERDLAQAFAKWYHEAKVFEQQVKIFELEVAQLAKVIGNTFQKCQQRTTAHFFHHWSDVVAFDKDREFTLASLYKLVFNISISANLRRQKKFMTRWIAFKSASKNAELGLLLFRRTVAGITKKKMGAALYLWRQQLSFEKLAHDKNTLAIKKLRKSTKVIVDFGNLSLARVKKGAFATWVNFWIHSIEQEVIVTRIVSYIQFAHISKGLKIWKEWVILCRMREVSQKSRKAAVVKMLRLTSCNKQLWALSKWRNLVIIQNACSRTSQRCGLLCLVMSQEKAERSQLSKRFTYWRKLAEHTKLKQVGTKLIASRIFHSVYTGILQRSFHIWEQAMRTQNAITKRAKALWSCLLSIEATQLRKAFSQWHRSIIAQYTQQHGLRLMRLLIQRWSHTAILRALRTWQLAMCQETAERLQIQADTISAMKRHLLIRRVATQWVTRATKGALYHWHKATLASKSKCLQAEQLLHMWANHQLASYLKKWARSARFFKEEDERERYRLSIAKCQLKEALNVLSHFMKENAIFSQMRAFHSWRQFIKAEKKEKTLQKYLHRQRLNLLVVCACRRVEAFALRYSFSVWKHLLTLLGHVQEGEKAVKQRLLLFSQKLFQVSSRSRLDKFWSIWKHYLSKINASENGMNRLHKVFASRDRKKISKHFWRWHISLQSEKIENLCSGWKLCSTRKLLSRFISQYKLRLAKAWHRWTILQISSQYHSSQNMTYLVHSLKQLFTGTYKRSLRFSWKKWCLVCEQSKSQQNIGASSLLASLSFVYVRGWLDKRTKAFGKWKEVIWQLRLEKLNEASHASLSTMSLRLKKDKALHIMALVIENEIKRFTNYCWSKWAKVVQEERLAAKIHLLGAIVLLKLVQRWDCNRIKRVFHLWHSLMLKEQMRLISLKINTVAAQRLSSLMQWGLQFRAFTVWVDWVDLVNSREMQVREYIDAIASFFYLRESSVLRDALLSWRAAADKEIHFENISSCFKTLQSIYSKSQIAVYFVSWKRLTALLLDKLTRKMKSALQFWNVINDRHQAMVLKSLEVWKASVDQVISMRSLAAQNKETASRLLFKLFTVRSAGALSRRWYQWQCFKAVYGLERENSLLLRQAIFYKGREFSNVFMVLFQRWELKSVKQAWKLWHHYLQLKKVLLRCSKILNFISKQRSSLLLVQKFAVWKLLTNESIHVEGSKQLKASFLKLVLGQMSRNSLQRAWSYWKQKKHLVDSRKRSVGMFLFALEGSVFRWKSVKLQRCLTLWKAAVLSIKREMEVAALLANSEQTSILQQLEILQKEAARRLYFMNREALCILVAERFLVWKNVCALFSQRKAGMLKALLKMGSLNTKLALAIWKRNASKLKHTASSIAMLVKVIKNMEATQQQRLFSSWRSAALKLKDKQKEKESACKAVVHFVARCRFSSLSGAWCRWYSFTALVVGQQPVVAAYNLKLNNAETRMQRLVLNSMGKTLSAFYKKHSFEILQYAFHCWQSCCQQLHERDVLQSTRIEKMTKTLRLIKKNSVCFAFRKWKLSLFAEKLTVNSQKGWQKTQALLQIEAVFRNFENRRVWQAWIAWREAYQLRHQEQQRKLVACCTTLKEFASRKTSFILCRAFVIWRQNSSISRLTEAVVQASIECEQQYVAKVQLLQDSQRKTGLKRILLHWKFRYCALSFYKWKLLLSVHQEQKLKQLQGLHRLQRFFTLRKIRRTIQWFGHWRIVVASSKVLTDLQSSALLSHQAEKVKVVLLSLQKMYFASVFKKWNTWKFFVVRQRLTKTKAVDKMRTSLIAAYSNLETMKKLKFLRRWNAVAMMLRFEEDNLKERVNAQKAGRHLQALYRLRSLKSIPTRISLNNALITWKLFCTNTQRAWISRLCSVKLLGVLHNRLLIESLSKKFVFWKEATRSHNFSKKDAFLKNRQKNIALQSLGKIFAHRTFCSLQAHWSWWKTFVSQKKISETWKGQVFNTVVRGVASRNRQHVLQDALLKWKASVFKLSVATFKEKLIKEGTKTLLRLVFVKASSSVRSCWWAWTNLVFESKQKETVLAARTSLLQKVLLRWLRRTVFFALSTWKANFSSKDCFLAAAKQMQRALLSSQQRLMLRSFFEWAKNANAASKVLAFEMQNIKTKVTTMCALLSKWKTVVIGRYWSHWTVCTHVGKALSEQHCEFNRTLLANKSALQLQEATFKIASLMKSKLLSQLAEAVRTWRTSLQLARSAQMMYKEKLENLDKTLRRAVFGQEARAFFTWRTCLCALKLGLQIKRLALGLALKYHQRDPLQLLKNAWVTWVYLLQSMRQVTSSQNAYYSKGRLLSVLFSQKRKVAVANAFLNWRLGVCALSANKTVEEFHLKLCSGGARTIRRVYVHQIHKHMHKFLIRWFKFLGDSKAISVHKKYSQEKLAHVLKTLIAKRIRAAFSLWMSAVITKLRNSEKSMVAIHMTNALQTFTRIVSRHERKQPQSSFQLWKSVYLATTQRRMLMVKAVKKMGLRSLRQGLHQTFTHWKRFIVEDRAREQQSSLTSHFEGRYNTLASAMRQQYLKMICASIHSAKKRQVLNAWKKWNKFIARKRTIQNLQIKSIKKMIFQRLALAFATWRMAVSSLKEEEISQLMDMHTSRYSRLLVCKIFSDKGYALQQSAWWKWKNTMLEFKKEQKKCRKVLMLLVSTVDKLCSRSKRDAMFHAWTRWCLCTLERRALRTKLEELHILEARSKESFLALARERAVRLVQRSVQLWSARFMCLAFCQWQTVVSQSKEEKRILLQVALRMKNGLLGKAFAKWHAVLQELLFGDILLVVCNRLNKSIERKILKNGLALLKVKTHNLAVIMTARASARRLLHRFLAQSWVGMVKRSFSKWCLHSIRQAVFERAMQEFTFSQQRQREQEMAQQYRAHIMERAVNIFRYPLLAMAWGKWQSLVKCSMKSEQNLKQLVHLFQSTTKKMQRRAVLQWSLATKIIVTALQKKKDSLKLFSRVLKRLIKKDLSRGWNAWLRVTFLATLEENQEARKVLLNKLRCFSRLEGLLASGRKTALFKAMKTWVHVFQNHREAEGSFKKAVEQTILRWEKRLYTIAFRRWLDIIHSRSLKNSSVLFLRNMVARFIFRSIQKFFFVWKDYSAGLVVKEQRSRAALIVFSRSANSLYKTGIFSAFTKAFMLWKFMAKAELTAAIQEISHLARGKQSKAVAILERAILHWSRVQLAHCWKKWNRCIVLAKSRIKAQKSAFTSMHRVRNHVLLAALYRSFSVWRQISISDKTVVKLHAISTCMLIKCSTKYARRFIMDRFQKWKATTAAMQIFESTFKAAVCTLESVYTKTFLRQAVQMWKQIVQRQASKQQLFVLIHSKLERFAQDETKRMFLTWKAVAYDLLKVNLLNDLERAKLAACLGSLEKCFSKLLRYSYCKAFNSWKFSALLHGKAFHYKRLFAAQRMVQVLCGSSKRVFLKCFKLWAFSSKLQKQDLLHTQQLLEIHQQHGLENLALKITQSMKLTLKILLNHVDKCLITYFLKWVQISKYLGALDEKRKKALSGIMQLHLNAQRLLLLKTVLTWKIGCMKDQLSIITHQRQRAMEAAKSNAAQVLARVYAEKESFCLAIALQKWHEQTITFQRMQHGSRLLFKFVQRLLHSSVYEALQNWKAVSERLKSRENLQSSQIEQASKLLFWLLQTRSKSTLRKGFTTWCINIKISDKLAIYKLKYSYFFQVLQKWASKQRENVVRAWTTWRTATEKAKLSVVLAFNKRERSAMMLTALLLRKSTHALASAIYDWRMYIHLQRTFGVEFIDRALILIRISKRMEHRLLLIFLKRWDNAAERKALNKWHEKRNLLEKSKLLREFRAQSLYRVLLKFTHNCSTKRICRAFMALQAASLLNRAENCLDIIHQGRLLKITSQCQRSACKMMDVAVQRLLLKQMYVAWQKWSSFWRRRDRIKRCLKNLIAHMRESRLYWAFDEWKAFCLAHWIETQKTALRRHQTLALGLEAMSPWAFRNKILKKVGGFQALQVLSEEGKQVAQNDADRLPLVLTAFLTRSNHAAINKCWLKWKVATFLMKATNERYQADALKFLRHEEQKLKAAF